jgi:hypothetical protein
MRITAALLMVCSLMLFGCGDDNTEQCIADFGFVVDGNSCNENGDSSQECPGVVCSCSSMTSTSYICLGGTCVTAINDCEAWCAASDEEQFDCM